MNTDSEPPVLVEPDVLEAFESEVVTELEPKSEPDNAAKPEPELAVIDEPRPKPEIGEPLMETSADLPAELVMELVPPTPAVRVPVTLRSPDLYDSLQIFLQETGSQLIKQFIVRSIVDSALTQKDMHVSATRALLKWPCFIADLL